MSLSQFVHVRLLLVL